MDREDSIDSDGLSEHSPEDDACPKAILPSEVIVSIQNNKAAERRLKMKNMRASRFGSQPTSPQVPLTDAKHSHANAQKCDGNLKASTGKRQAALRASNAIKKQALQCSSDGQMEDEQDAIPKQPHRTNARPASKKNAKGSHQSTKLEIKDKNLQAVLDAHRGSFGNSLTSPEPPNVVHHAARVRSNMTPEQVKSPMVVRGTARGKSRLAGVDSSIKKTPGKLEHASMRLMSDKRNTTTQPPKGNVLQTITAVAAEEDDDLDVLDSFHQAIRKAMDSQTALSERISQQKLQLLKMEMERTLERAYASSKMKYSQVAHTSQTESTSAIRSLHRKLEEMSEYFKQQQQAVRSMKEQCEELEKNAQSILESSQEHINSLHQAELTSLSSLNQTLHDQFVHGIQDIQQSRKRSRPQL